MLGAEDGAVDRWVRTGGALPTIPLPQAGVPPSQSLPLREPSGVHRGRCTRHRLPTPGNPSTTLAASLGLRGVFPPAPVGTDLLCPPFPGPSSWLPAHFEPYYAPKRALHRGSDGMSEVRVQRARQGTLPHFRFPFAPIPHKSNGLDWSIQRVGSRGSPGVGLGGFGATRGWLVVWVGHGGLAGTRGCLAGTGVRLAVQVGHEGAVAAQEAPGEARVGGHPTSREERCGACRGAAVAAG